LTTVAFLRTFGSSISPRCLRITSIYSCSTTIAMKLSTNPSSKSCWPIKMPFPSSSGSSWASETSSRSAMNSCDRISFWLITTRLMS
jgi:hypothetical protein